MIDNLSQDALTAAREAKAAALNFGQAHWWQIAAVVLALGIGIGLAL